MGTKTLNDIHNDIKQLITAVTSFEENEEGFRICERYCMSNVKHHRYLSVNSHATKEAIKGLVNKFTIHGNYEVAKKFQELVDTFLSSFDFEQHPQYDLQWCLLTLLLDLSTETHRSDLESLKLSRGECTFNTTGGNETDVTEEIDWAEYLKEGQDNFFCDYKSDSESEWSEDTDEEFVDAGKQVNVPENISDQNKAVPVVITQTPVDKLSVSISRHLESRNWLLTNVQNTWWNELDWRKYAVTSKFCDAHLCEIWHKSTETDVYPFGTLSEYQACRELLWMFQVQTHMVVFQQTDKKNFSVRPRISIPSLTITSFHSILSPFCKYFSMLYEMEEFGHELYVNHSDLQKNAPLTYEAYNAAVRQHFIEFKNEILNIEKNLMKQETTNTFLSLSMRLKSRLSIIEILYEVYKIVVSDWRTCQNWECASKLLSGLYFEMQKSHSRQRANICADLYLSSLSVYLNIIDTWLSEGRLEDWRDEFIIVRLLKDTPTEDNERYEAFTVRSLDNICKADPIMQFLIRKIQHMGQSIELLVSLDRITEIWKVNIREDETRRSLIDEFSTKLQTEILKYSTCDVNDEITSISQTDESSISQYDEDVEKSIVQQLSEINNPFLMKAFENYIPPILFKKDVVRTPVHSVQKDKALINNLFERLEKVSDYILPFRKILENTLFDILVSRYNSASKLVKNIMTDEYKLEEHLKLMRSVYMMEAGHIMSKFYHVLFCEIETNQMWSNSYFLSCILEEILSQQWPNSSSRWSITVCDTNTHQVLNAVDNITLQYAVGWPVNIILDEQSLKKYNEIFRFQLKLKWALWTLNNLRFSDLEGSKSEYKRNKLEQFQIRRLESLRFWLLHAIGSIHAYLSGQVLQNLGLILEKSLTQANSLDTIMSVHTEYLRKVHEHCLLTTEFKDLMSTISNLIEMCSHVRSRWNYKKLIFAITELDVMESSYIKYHTYLALTLHNAVQNKDANYYELTRYRETRIDSDTPGESDRVINPLNDLSRSLLTEIAHQYLPPSGLPIPIPSLIHKTDFYRRGFNSEYSLPNEVCLNEYEQTFSYIRWYQCEEQFIMFNSPSYFIQNEMASFIQEAQNLEASSLHNFTE